MIGHAWAPPRAAYVGERVLKAAQTFVRALRPPLFKAVDADRSRVIPARAPARRRAASLSPTPPEPWT